MINPNEGLGEAPVDESVPAGLASRVGQSATATGRAVGEAATATGAAVGKGASSAAQYVAPEGSMVSRTGKSVGRGCGEDRGRSGGGRCGGQKGSHTSLPGH